MLTPRLYNVSMPSNTTIAYVLDYPNEAAREIEQLRAALKAYVDDAREQTSQGRPGSPFALRLAAAEAALAMGRK